MEVWSGPLIVVCWAAWAAVWFAGWLYNLRRGPKTRRRAGQWPCWLIAAAVWAFAGGGHGPATGLMLRVPWLQFAGAVVLIGGTAFAIWARVVLGRMWSSAPSVKEGHQLRTDGPYAIVRHPIYTGMLAMMLGMALAGDRWWQGLLFVVFVAAILVRSGTEERLMRETFGERYAAYQRRTPRLVPGLGRWGGSN